MASAKPTSFTLEPGKDGGVVLLIWNREALGPPGRETGADEARSPWSVEGEVDWGRAEALRLVSALFEDGRELAVAAIRPRDAAGHDAETLGSHLVEDGEAVAVEEALLSTEYDAGGLPRRLGLELWLDSERPPLRVSADRDGEPRVSGEGIRRQTTRMSFRLGGTAGSGLYEVLRPA
jgi:hypothetical protein